MRKLLASLIFLLSAAPALAFEVSLPIRCTPGMNCFIQNYVDTVSGDKYGDYKCGSLSYNNHDGTDFRLPSYVEMQRGVDVVAAADGVVLASRDGMEDANVRGVDPRSILNRECGNAVVIDHGEGWQTQYCHMKKGTVKLKKGAKITAGQTLGMVGLSGQTAFPHLHFAVRYKGKELDPFTGRRPNVPCDTNEELHPLWNKDTLYQLTYQPTALLNAGFNSQEPEAERARAGQHSETEISMSSHFIMFWVDIMGTQRDDILTMSITKPDGKILANIEKTFTKNSALQFVYTGAKLSKETRWDKGTYIGKMKLERPQYGGKRANVLSREFTVTVF